MKTFRKNKVLGCLLMMNLFSMVFVSACGTDPVVMTSALGESDVQQLDHDSFDGLTPLRVRTDGISLSVLPVLKIVQTSEEALWVMSFDSSRPMVSVLSYGSDGELGDARLLSSYKFEVRLDGGEIHAMLSGEPLYFMIHTEDGDNRRFSGIVRLAPLFIEQAGSCSIWLNPALELVDMDGSPILAGHVTASSRIRHLSITSDAGIEPVSISTDAKGLWTFSFLPASIRDLLASPGAYVYLMGEDADGFEYNVRALPALAVEQLGITSGDELSL